MFDAAADAVIQERYETARERIADKLQGFLSDVHA